MLQHQLRADGSKLRQQLRLLQAFRADDSNLRQHLRSRPTHCQQALTAADQRIEKEKLPGGVEKMKISFQAALRPHSPTVSAPTMVLPGRVELRWEISLWLSPWLGSWGPSPRCSSSRAIMRRSAA